MLSVRGLHGDVGPLVLVFKDVHWVGQIAPHGARWLAVGGLDALEVPPTLQGLITASLDRLSPEVKALLQRASLPGRLFSTSALAALVGGPPKPEHLREAVRRDLLVVDEKATAEMRGGTRSRR